MNIKAALPVIISLILTACTQHTPSDKTPVVGEAVDSVAIANDTVQQENIEGSYEYAQTIIVSPKLAYDVRAYGGPASQGQLCILRRGADNKSDTVIQLPRHGIIQNAFFADLNNNGEEEIYVVQKQVNTNVYPELYAFEFSTIGKPTVISIDKLSKFMLRGSQVDTTNQGDSIYINKETLYERFSDKTEYEFTLRGTEIVPKTKTNLQSNKK